jgi:hypothetical protein
VGCWLSAPAESQQDGVESDILVIRMPWADVAKPSRETNTPVLIAAQGATVFAASLTTEAVVTGMLFLIFSLGRGDKNFTLQPRDGFESHRHRSDVFMFLRLVISA